jgi:hypothetical protein
MAVKQRSSCFAHHAHGDLAIRQRLRMREWKQFASEMLRPQAFAVHPWPDIVLGLGLLYPEMKDRGIHDLRQCPESAVHQGDLLQRSWEAQEWCGTL